MPSYIPRADTWQDCTAKKSNKNGKMVPSQEEEARQEGGIINGMEKKQQRLVLGGVG